MLGTDNWWFKKILGYFLHIFNIHTMVGGSCRKKAPRGYECFKPYCIVCKKQNG